MSLQWAPGHQAGPRTKQTSRNDCCPGRWGDWCQHQITGLLSLRAHPPAGGTSKPRPAPTPVVRAQEGPGISRLLIFTDSAGASLHTQVPPTALHGGRPGSRWARQVPTHGRCRGKCPGPPRDVGDLSLRTGCGFLPKLAPTPRARPTSLPPAPGHGHREAAAHSGLDLMEPTARAAACLPL